MNGGFFYARLEEILNTALALDPDTAARLQRLEGRSIHVRLAAPMPEVRLTVREGRIVVLDAAAGTADVQVSGSPSAFARIAFGGFEPRMFADGEIVIEGDAELARELRAITRELDPDWEEWLARRIGDVPAHELGNAVRGLRRFLAGAATTMVRDAGEFLGEESGLLAPRARVERWLADVDELASDLERLAERVRRLEAGRGGRVGSGERHDPNARPGAGPGPESGPGSDPETGTGARGES